jgi:hypothetical protein
LVDTTIGVTDMVVDRVADAITRMRRGVDQWLTQASAGRTTGGDEGFVEAGLAMAGITRVTGDDAAGLTLGASAVAECRTSGLTAWLPWALVNLSITEALAGRHSAAMVSGTEGLQLARDLDQPTGDL